MFDANEQIPEGEGKSSFRELLVDALACVGRLDLQKSRLPGSDLDSIPQKSTAQVHCTGMPRLKLGETSDGYKLVNHRQDSKILSKTNPSSPLRDTKQEDGTILQGVYLATNDYERS